MMEYSVLTHLSKINYNNIIIVNISLYYIISNGSNAHILTSAAHITEH